LHLNIKRRKKELKVGIHLSTIFFLPFELISILVLVALIDGVVVVAREYEILELII